MGDDRVKDKEEIIPHPYTYLPARAVWRKGVLKWFDLETNEELPPYYGYGKRACELIVKWYGDKGLDLPKKGLRLS